jgi:hypothetical protein
MALLMLKKWVDYTCFRGVLRAGCLRRLLVGLIQPLLTVRFVNNAVNFLDGQQFTIRMAPRILVIEDSLMLIRPLCRLVNKQALLLCR